MKTKRKIQCAIVIIGVIVLPLLYSYFYLGAFWDPYARLDTLPVAVVNNDKGTEVDGEVRNLGEEVCKQLKKSGSLKFIFTNEKDAQKGTTGDRYYAMIVVPEEFSQQIASSATLDKQPATITYSSNQKRNYLASQILNSAVTMIEESVRSNVNKEITQQLADKLKQVPEQLLVLQDGANKLNNGAETLFQGNEKLRSGLGELVSGADGLAKGTRSYQAKMNEYSAGIAGVKTGSGALETGISDLDKGIDKLIMGTDQVVASTEKLEQLKLGAVGVEAGAKEFNNKLNGYIFGVDALIAAQTDPTLIAQAQIIAPYSGQLKAASAQIVAGTTSLADGTKTLPELRAALLQIQSGLRSADAGAGKLTKGSQSLNEAMNKISLATN